nr:hypothetical protein BaRGS_034407 [Batillaria attramentaria]
MKIRVLFLLGQVDEKQDNLQAALDYEHNLYKDTVQGPFLDTYFNLTHKGVLGFNWISHYCPRARVVFKMDDDVFVDTFQLIHHVLPMLDGKRRTILCSVWFNDTMPIMRNETSPWRVEEKLFCGLKRYPFDYCSGMAVIITGDLIPSLYRAAFFTPFFWIDDLYLFGMLPSVAGDVTLYDVGMGRNMTLNASLALDCKVREGHKCPVLATTASEYPNKFEELWNVTYWLHVNPGWRLPFARVE